VLRGFTFCLFYWINQVNQNMPYIIKGTCLNLVVVTYKVGFFQYIQCRRGWCCHEKGIWPQKLNQILVQGTTKPPLVSLSKFAVTYIKKKTFYFLKITQKGHFRKKEPNASKTRVIYGRKISKRIFLDTG
jgi:hypothetical protein